MLGTTRLWQGAWTHFLVPNESSGSTASAQGCAPARRRQSPGRGERMRTHHIRVGTENSLSHQGPGAPASSVLRRGAECAGGRACSTWGRSRRLGPRFSLRVHASCGAPLPNTPNSREPRVPSLFQKMSKVKAAKGLRTCFHPWPPHAPRRELRLPQGSAPNFAVFLCPANIFLINSLFFTLMHLKENYIITLNGNLYHLL